MTMLTLLTTLVIFQGGSRPPVRFPIVANIMVYEPGNVSLHANNVLYGMVSPKVWRNFVPPKYAPVESRILGGRPVFYVTSNELMAIYPGKGETPEKLAFFREDGSLIREVKVPPDSGFPRYENSNNIFFPGTGEWFHYGQTIKLPPIPGAGNRLLAGIFDENKFVAAWTDSGREDVPLNTGTGRFAIFEIEKGWTSPPVPKGFRHTILFCTTSEGHIGLTLSKEDLKGSLGYLLFGQEIGPNGEDNLRGHPRFYKDGRYFGADPPDMKLPKGFEGKQLHCAEDKIGPYEFYSTYVLNRTDQVYRTFLRVRYMGKWFEMKDLVPEISAKQWLNTSFSVIRDNHILFNERNKGVLDNGYGRAYLIKIQLPKK